MGQTPLLGELATAILNLVLGTFKLLTNEAIEASKVFNFKDRSTAERTLSKAIKEVAIRFKSKLDRVDTPQEIRQYSAEATLKLYRKILLSLI